MNVTKYAQLKTDTYDTAVRPLTDAEYERLKADIDKHGVQTPIIITSAGIVVDGHHRLEIAQDLNIPVKHVPFEETSVKDPAALAVSLNACRRQLSDDELTAYVHEAVAAGKSVRTIAKAAGVSKSAVARKAKTAPVKPAAVKAANGKTQTRSSSTRKAAVAKRKAPAQSPVDKALAAYVLLSVAEQLQFMSRVAALAVPAETPAAPKASRAKKAA
jgi:ParB-like chromosome segregation protein Spo0J